MLDFLDSFVIYNFGNTILMLTLTVYDKYVKNPSTILIFDPRGSTGTSDILFVMV